MLLQYKNKLCEEIMSLGLLSSETLTKLNCFIFWQSDSKFEFKKMSKLGKSKYFIKKKYKYPTKLCGVHGNIIYSILFYGNMYCLFDCKKTIIF